MTRADGTKGLQVSKPELATLAVGELGGARAPVDTEDIAVKAHELAPTAFAWRRYPERVNLELVRVALVDASRPKGGASVQGRGRAGWVLTNAGVAWYESHREQLLAALGGSGEAGSAIVKQPETAHRERERIRVKGTTAWGRWGLQEPVSGAEALRVFRVDQYTSAHNRLLKVRALLELFANDAELGAFLSDMAATATTDVPERSGS